ncbi:MAG TPA: AMP-binding protein [Spirochaetota bacterium]|nr:AMP-binding protein [Spirochaetota bacterium]
MEKNVKFRWYGHYPEIIPREIRNDRYKSLSDMFLQCVEKYSDLPAFESFGTAMTYREMDRLTQNFAAFLQSEGLRKGDRLALILPNTLQYPISMFGAIRAGLVIVNINPLYTSREIEEKLKDSGARAVVVLSVSARKLQKIISRTDVKTVIITGPGDMAGLRGMFINFYMRWISRETMRYRKTGSTGFRRALRIGSRLHFNPAEPGFEDIAFLQYTGGTTGTSKGAVLKHKNILANIEQISAWMLPGVLEGEEVVLTPLPLYHIFALTVNLFAFFSRGAKNVLIADPRKISSLVREMKKYRLTSLTGVNTLFNLMLNQHGFGDVRFARLKIVIAGGMAVHKSVSDGWLKATGIPLCEGYGLTEASPVLTCNPIDGTDRPGTVGLPLPGTEIIIADDNGNEVPLYTHGEILAKGPQVMDCYWNNEEETARVFINGWLRTGDIAFMDRDGFITIVDRKKDMINVSGFNVYPSEVEDVATMYTKVLEAGCTGGTDEHGNEYVKLFAVKKDPALTEDELLTHLRKNLTGYKMPAGIEFRESLPKSSIGKVLRRELE